MMRGETALVSDGALSASSEGSKRMRWYRRESWMQLTPGGLWDLQGSPMMDKKILLLYFSTY